MRGPARINSYYAASAHSAPDRAELDSSVECDVCVVGGGIAGKLVAQAIAGTAERFDVFARIPHRDFPGGAALRQPALAVAMLYYRLRDLL